MANRWMIIAACLLCALSTWGCSMLKGPQQSPAPAPQGKQLRGAESRIIVYMHETGEKKQMMMEEYVAGVVAGEMKNDWPVNALAAQAVIARTFAVHAMEEKGGVPARGTDASTDIREFQAYNAAAVNDSVRKAVEMTRGQVMTHNGRPVIAWFHASAGGITATAKEGLNYREAEPPYIQSVQSPDELAPPEVQRWTAEFPVQELMAAAAKIGQKLDRVERVEIGQKGPSGRTTVLSVNGTIQLNGPDLRVHLGSTKLKSMLLEKVELSGDRVAFTGRGYGHGVGMSQWGANKLARDGAKPEDILNHYFKGIVVEKRWE